MKPTTVDFETAGIEPRPSYPPVPVGVAIKRWGRKARYYAWGHPAGNNCTLEEARRALAAVWSSPEGVLCHNAKFDVDVAETHFGLPRLDWSRMHDTLFLLYLDDPHQPTFSLKPSAERLLGLKPEEQDAVADWLLEHQPVEGVRISRAKSSPHYFGRYISLAPGKLVGQYAIGDVERTEALFELLYPRIVELRMLVAYDRERQLMPILLQMERQGIRLDLQRLHADAERYRVWMGRIDGWLVERLRCPGLNLDSGPQLVEALSKSCAVDLLDLPRTKTGKHQTNKAALAGVIADKQLVAVLKYRAQLKTCLGTFIEPWSLAAQKTGGFIYTAWNQTRSTEGGGPTGTRTGRLSCHPNVQNIPKSFKPIFADAEKPFDDLPDLPRVRSYILPLSEGEVLVGRDFSSQELRILAHFEDAEMLRAYRDDPRVDLHAYAAELIRQTTGIEISRDGAKTIGFAILYGAGLAKLAATLGCSVDQARALKHAYLNTFPGVRDLMDDLRVRARQGLPIRTLGGRLYHCEPSRLIDGRIVDFSYKMLNYLIQGSAADMTKDAIIRFAGVGSPGKLLFSVHDELLVSAPRMEARGVIKALEEVMGVSALDVPSLSDGETGANWGSMEAV